MKHVMCNRMQYVMTNRMQYVMSNSDRNIFCLLSFLTRDSLMFCYRLSLTHTNVTYELKVSHLLEITWYWHLVVMMAVSCNGRLSELRFDRFVCHLCMCLLDGGWGCVIKLLSWGLLRQLDFCQSLDFHAISWCMHYYSTQWTSLAVQRQPTAVSHSVWFFSLF